jgi:hypothetical protein
MLTSFPAVPAEVMPCLTGSYMSNQFLACGLLITLMIVPVRTSETLVNSYQSTQRYTPEDSNLPIFCCLYINMVAKWTHEMEVTINLQNIKIWLCLCGVCAYACACMCICIHTCMACSIFYEGRS